MMRKTLLLLATAAIATWASLAQAEDRSITVSAIGGTEGISDLLPEFEKATGIHVNFQALPYPALRQRSIAAFVGGSVDSDVYWEDIIWLGEWAQNGYVRPLDDLIARDLSKDDIADFLPGAWNAQSKWDGKTWTMPFGAYYFLNYYRTDLFDAAGIKAPVTFEDVNKAAEALNKPDARQFGIAMPYQRGGPITSWFLATYTGAGGSLLKNPPDDLTPTLDSPLALDVLKNYIGWMKFAPPSVASYHWDDQTVAMQTGRLAMAPTFSVNGALFAKADQSVVAGKVGYTFMPRFKPTDPAVIPFGGWGVGIAAKTTKVEDSWAFVKWVTSADIQKRLAVTTGTPVRYSALQDPELQKSFPWFSLILDAEKNGQVFPNYRPRYPFYPQIEEELGKQLNMAALGQITPEEALKTANANIAAIITKAGYTLPAAK